MNIIGVLRGKRSLPEAEVANALLADDVQLARQSRGVALVELGEGQAHDVRVVTTAQAAVAGEDEQHLRGLRLDRAHERVGGLVPAARIFLTDAGEGDRPSRWTPRLEPLDGSMKVLEGTVLEDD